ncbi:metal-sensitive transcriptional regulator [Microcella humidisoli]|jgi:DNA-binding FrmR family transcriptional regulator|uniref:Metal-sensitive transcriptional regulator n=1 Tax=Microcella humidisoli TaxID=2963406 RepID=A0ABY5FUT6_9MICO|nr:metal-sensitive transcriptional regulator [Microcella humidisoli]UTT62048.1 metal-sensitive transcriptional regulator [Microcella humidisoli]
MTTIPADEAKKIANRLRRAQGQLGAVLTMIEDGRDCRDIVTQLSAASSAIDRAGFAIIASALKECLRDGENGGDPVEVADLEKLFLSLA